MKILLRSQLCKTVEKEYNEPRYGATVLQGQRKP